MEDNIAIIGMAGRFPGAKNIDEFWFNIENGVESIVVFDDQELLSSGVPQVLLDNPNYIRAKGYLKNAALFDADFFNFSAYEATMLDPQFRLFFEVVWEALENAAYVPGSSNDRVGVFAGCSTSNYGDALSNEEGFVSESQSKDMLLLTHNAKDFLTTLLAYKLNLTGPCVNVQTACSTSLVSIWMACESLLASSCEIALAGGVSVTTPLKSGYLYQDGMILSKDGHCRTFDEKAVGTVPGNGLGVLVLKRLSKALEDHDNIHAIIRGGAVNNDGSNKIGFSAPSVEGQKKVIEAALDRAKITPNDIAYLEAHGTGTLIGDPIEVRALGRVFSKQGVKSKVALGALKPNIGHLDVAAGVAGVIKTIEALKHKCFPPNINFKKLNSAINLNDINFCINTSPVKWAAENSSRFAGVSSFGIGGTNAHLVLQEAPQLPGSCNDDLPVLIVLSAKKRTGLIRRRRKIINYLKLNPAASLKDIAYTLQVGRKTMQDRFACICFTKEQAIERLGDLDQLEALQVNDDTLCESTKLAYETLYRLAKQWLAKEDVNWQELYRASKPFKLALPTYPFESREYWAKPYILKDHSTTERSSPSQKRKFFSRETIELEVTAIFKSFLGSDQICATDDFYDLGGDSLLILQLIEEIRKKLGVEIPESKLSSCSTPKEIAAYIYIKLNDES
ncbi:MAG: hypothetical protein COV52_04440 [Gammaproteobacteria bacterium CG11_big_fil_rev_8_21_14_0_20_46_22]|nr:MAG: hypothetical protein COV52_04440 [Gammaproteobacteria bacterium CG11_big_fil_rev_8_21_14_0_20_46_22]